MVKYTTSELIEILSIFPDDTPISNDLCLIWDFPEDTIKGSDNPIKTSQENATRLGLFEGDWNTEGMAIKAENFKNKL